jgi:uncharacterized protein (DUF169 family)
MPQWSELATGLQEVLHLTQAPLAISFSEAAPEGVPAYSDPMPAPTADGRTGRVPAGCVFWMRAAERSFTTEAADHANCSVGSFTHGFVTAEEIAGKSDVGALVESGWAPAGILDVLPKVKSRPGHVTYGPLADTSVDPDVVLVRLNAKQAMVLSDAVPGLRFEGKPQCHIIPMAKEDGEVAVSVGCMLSRVRTGMPSTEMTAAIPAARLAEVVESLERTNQADSAVAVYASEDAARFG